MSFVHLHVHSEYSLIDGLATIPELLKTAAKHKQTTLALTDVNNVFAVVKFYKEAVKQGIKPIVGAEISIESPNKTLPAPRIVLLCRNEEGYYQLLRLLSRGYEDVSKASDVKEFQIKQDWLKKDTDGLIVLSGGMDGDIGQIFLKGDKKEAKNTAAFWQEHFPDRYYLEISRTQRKHEEDYNQFALELAETNDMPVVASNNTRFMQKEQFDAHEVRVCIAEKRKLDDQREQFYTQEQYMKTSEQMEDLFADIPSSISNTMEIAKRCSIHIETGKILLPTFPLEEGKDENEELKRQAEEGLERLSKKLHAARKGYDERLDKELSIIYQMDYAGYFLIVADIVKWAKANDIPVGPGRGSGAGSLTAYALGITTVDPLQYDLLFERFLNPERISMPDFDIDVCVEKRNQVIDYIAQRYGRDKVSQIITFGSMTAKSVVRDVGRVLGHGYGYVDEIAKLIPNALNITLKTALKGSHELKQRYENEEEVTRLIDTSLKLEGLSRNPGTHAGGIVIAPKALTKYTAIYSDPKEQNHLTHFDMKDLEQIGLVKFDFLGLRTLTIIDKTLRCINQDKTKEKLILEDIPLDDPKTYALLQQGDTTAVFQLESEGIRALLKDLRPEHFEDIVALIALYRPGPLESNMVDDYIKGRRGGKVEYLHPQLEKILKPTYGVIVYQEQVMQIAQVLSGYSLGAADILRRAMGKKLKEEMEEQRSAFVQGAIEQGNDETAAVTIFDLIALFAGYGFNRSHSVAYAYLAYQTAWLKTHYTTAFMSVVLSSDMRNTDKISYWLYECRNKKFGILPPNVNKSKIEFINQGADKICYGLGAIKHLNESFLQHLIQEREENGPFQSLIDFCMRMIPLGLTVAKFKILVGVNAFGSLAVDKEELNASDDSLKHVQRIMMQHAEIYNFSKERSNDIISGQESLFGTDALMTSMPTAEYTLSQNNRSKQQWSRSDLLDFEYAHLGFYLTHHPLQDYQNEIKQCIRKVQPQEKTIKHNSKTRNTSFFAGVIIQIKHTNSAYGKRALLMLDTGEACYEVSVDDEIYNKSIDLLLVKKMVVIGATPKYERKSKQSSQAQHSNELEAHRWKAWHLYGFDQLRSQYAASIQIDVLLEQAEEDFIQSIKNALQAYISKEGQGCAVKIIVQEEKNVENMEMYLPKQWHVQPREELLTQLRNIAGVCKTIVLY